MKKYKFFFLSSLITLNTISIMAKDIIFNFEKNKDFNQWLIVNDNVMGGVSESYLSISNDGNGVFKGKISTKNNGGFCSVSLDISRKYIGKKNILILKIKGDKKDYQFRLKVNKNDYYSYITTFKTSGEWEEIKIPLTKMYPSFRGRKLKMQNYNSKYFEQIAILIGNKRNEKFKLIIDKISLE